ncbi:MAG: hypothetical protein HKO59_05435 [Phycisphaerales bacterium]|nr:hypothetical protein [Phycisphaerae bacterium]NNF41906.1 hypothetical protein [Phycisphaerales bacterium]NNM25416.1 hypothetical protein [Phycisphaerales bacterium]
MSLPRARGALTALFLINGLATLVGVGVLGGCATTEGTATGPGDAPTLNAETRVDSAAGDDDSLLTLAQQAADLSADFADQRRQPPAVTRAIPDPPSIRWNTPGVSSARRPGQTPETLPPRQGPLARDTPPPIDLPAKPDLRATTPATHADTAAMSVDQLKLQLVNLRQELYQHSIGSDQPVRELIAIASTALIDPDVPLPDSARSDLTEDELALVEKLHEFFRHVGARLRDDDPADEVIVDAIRELQASVVDEPELVLPAALLCWRVADFGDYERFDPNAFLAHNEQQVILYLEIEGFVSELNKKQQWVTEISQSLEIYPDADGIPVWSMPWQKAVDASSKQRRDFFTTQLITLPKALSVGRHHLKVRVRDEHSGALAEVSIPFDMVADPKLAARVGK